MWACSSAGERLFGVEEVEGSIPSRSTKTKHDKALRDFCLANSTSVSASERCAQPRGASDAIQSFLTSLRVSGASGRTLDNRERVLVAVCRFIGDDRLTAWGRPKLVAFFESVRLAGRKPLTVHTYASIVHRFLRWCVEAELLRADPLVGFTVRTPKALPRVPTADEVRSLIRACGTETIEAQRNRALVFPPEVSASLVRLPGPPTVAGEQFRPFAF